jgi:hypothetical protein
MPDRSCSHPNGTGKTRSGCEWIRELIKLGYKNLAMVAPTQGDIRSVLIEGVSGILSCSWAKDVDYAGNAMGFPSYEPSKRHRLTWVGKPTNKAVSTAAEPVERRAEAKGNASQQSTRRTHTASRNEKRFAVTHPSGSRMPELGPYGSVRGALSNERPYRDLGNPRTSHVFEIL